MRQKSAVLQFSFTTTKSEVLCPNFYLKSISAVTLAQFYGQNETVNSCDQTESAAKSA